jgi:hypothetical protein
LKLLAEYLKLRLRSALTSSVVETLNGTVGHTGTDSKTVNALLTARPLVG